MERLRGEMGEGGRFDNTHKLLDPYPPCLTAVSRHCPPKRQTLLDSLDVSAAYLIRYGDSFDWLKCPEFPVSNFEFVLSDWNPWSAWV
jgi:hypothetical protein